MRKAIHESVHAAAFGQVSEPEALEFHRHLLSLDLKLSWNVRVTNNPSSFAQDALGFVPRFLRPHRRRKTII